MTILCVRKKSDQSALSGEGLRMMDNCLITPYKGREFHWKDDRLTPRLLSIR